jgi:DNA polymerase I
VSDRARLVEFLGPADHPDADYYVENQVLPAALRVLEYFGITDADIAGKAGQRSLKDWFG